ncbi:glycosyltransferase family 4 protein [Profundibacter sp.]
MEPNHNYQIKRVLLVASYAESLLNFRGQLIKNIIALGHEVIIAAPDISQTTHSQLLKMGATVFETPLARTGLNPVKDLKYMFAIKAIIKSTKPDLLLTYTIKPNIWGAFAARSTNTESVAMVTGLGYAFTDSGSKSLVGGLLRRIAAALYRAATNYNKLVIFQNPDDRDDFISSRCLSNSAKARLVNGSGVDMSYYSDAPLPDQPVFLMVSRLLGNKGVREYCAAALAVLKTHPQARFLLVGYIDEGPDGISQAELDTWIDGGVEYKGPQADVRPFVAQASVYVLPSYREGTPRSVLEAMSMGRPIITSDAPGCRETVIDGETGFLVPVCDVDALADRMRWMIEHPEQRAIMGKSSKNLAREKYDVIKVNKALLDHLELSQ